MAESNPFMKKLRTPYGGSSSDMQGNKEGNYYISQDLRFKAGHEARPPPS